MNNTEAFLLALSAAAKQDAAIEKAQAKINEARETVSGTLHGLAKLFESVDAFLTECGIAEAAYKGAKNRIIPRCWTQAKSNIKQAWEKGLAPANFETESELRAALNAQRKADKAEKEGEALPVIRVRPEHRALLLAVVEADKADHESTNAAAAAFLAQLNAILNAALPKGEPAKEAEAKKAA